jgi:hypothetical protein
MKRAGHLYRYDVPTPPGATNWVYQRIAEGQFVRVAKKKIQDFYEGDRPLKPSPDGFVYIVTFLIGIENRRPTLLMGQWNTKHKVDSSGFLDEAHWLDGQRCAVEHLPRLLHVSENEDDEARLRMLKRREQVQHRWEMTDDDADAIVAELFKRGVPDLRPIPIEMFSSGELKGKLDAVMEEWAGEQDLLYWLKRLYNTCAALYEKHGGLK